MEGLERQEELEHKTSPSEQQKPFIRVKSKWGTEHVHYPIVYEGFPDEFQTIANTNLKETPEARKKGLQRLREYMKRQGKPLLKDELPLLAALRNCKYDLEKAESKLNKFLHTRQNLIVQLRNLGMEKIQRIVDDTPFWMGPYRDKFGTVILNTRPCAINLEDDYGFAEVGIIFKAGILFQLSFPITTVSGVVYIGDCSVPYYHMYYSIFKELRTVTAITESLPIRVVHVEILNENSVCRAFYNLCKVIFSKKLMSRVKLHGTNLKEIHERYGPDILPEEYGGNAGPISSKPYKEKFLDFIRDLMNEEC